MFKNNRVIALMKVLERIEMWFTYRKGGWDRVTDMDGVSDRLVIGNVNIDRNRVSERNGVGSRNKQPLLAQGQPSSRTY